MTSTTDLTAATDSWMKIFTHFPQHKKLPTDEDNGVGKYLSVQLRDLNPSEHTNNNQPNLKGGGIVENCTVIWRKSGKVNTLRLDYDAMGLGRGMLILSSMKFRVVQKCLSNLLSTIPESGGAWKHYNQPEQDHTSTTTTNFWTANQEWSLLGNFTLIPGLKINDNNQPLSLNVPTIVNGSLVFKNDVHCRCWAPWNGWKTVVKGQASSPHFWKKFSNVTINKGYLKDKQAKNGRNSKSSRVTQHLLTILPWSCIFRKKISLFFRDLQIELQSSHNCDMIDMSSLYSLGLAPFNKL